MDGGGVGYSIGDASGDEDGSEYDDRRYWDDSSSASFSSSTYGASSLESQHVALGPHALHASSLSANCRPKQSQHVVCRHGSTTATAASDTQPLTHTLLAPARPSSRAVRRGSTLLVARAYAEARIAVAIACTSFSSPFCQDRSPVTKR